MHGPINIRLKKFQISFRWTTVAFIKRISSNCLGISRTKNVLSVRQLRELQCLSLPRPLKLSFHETEGSNCTNQNSNQRHFNKTEKKKKKLSLWLLVVNTLFVREHSLIESSYVETRLICKRQTSSLNSTDCCSVTEKCKEQLNTKLMNLPLQRLSESGSISLDESDSLLSPHPLFIILVAQSLSP